MTFAAAEVTILSNLQVKRARTNSNVHVYTEMCTCRLTCARTNCNVHVQTAMCTYKQQCAHSAPPDAFRSCKFLSEQCLASTQQTLSWTD